MNAIDMQEPVTGLVELDDLICPGCFEPVLGERPLGWPATAGVCPEFSHPDGSVLCPDAGGAIGEPVEASQLRFRLTEQGRRALGGSFGARS